MGEPVYDEKGNQIIDVSDLAFIYNNVVSFVNSVCLDISVIGKLNYLKAKNLVTEEKQPLFHFIERRTYLSLIVTLDTIIDDPNVGREDGNKIHNNGINLIKLLNLTFSAAQQTKDKKEKENQLNFIRELIKMHDDIQQMDERKNLGMFRDRLAAHIDVGFVKDEKYSEFDMGNKQFIAIIDRVLIILHNLSKLLNVTDGEPLHALKPYSFEDETPVDGLFVLD